MSKSFINYAEQVKYSVLQKVLFNNYPIVNPDYINNDLQVGTLQALEYGDVYQWYAVELVLNEDTETERLGIFWDDTLEMYIMPVTHFGTSWTGVSPVKENENIDD